MQKSQIKYDQIRPFSKSDSSSSLLLIVITIRSGRHESIPEARVILPSRNLYVAFSTLTDQRRKTK